MKTLAALILLICIPAFSFAQIDQPKEVNTLQKFGKYTVHYSVFNSKQIPPQVAELYKLTRSKDIVYLNISLTKTDNGSTTLGLPAQVKAKAVNLMQQSRAVEFIEVKEPEATYYLAPFRHTDEEDIRFEVSVLPVGDTTPLTLSFNRRLYIQN